jgi:4'-phosphopantetheinyl transferase EntD
LSAGAREVEGDRRPPDLGRAREALAEIVGPDVAVAVWGIDTKQEELLSVEAHVVERAVSRRRTEFARGRSCARAALQALGGPSIAIASGEHREPLFPEGFVGSITHCEGFVAAAIGRATAFTALGIDAELARAMPGDVEALVLTDGERAFGMEPVHSLLVFSAKEAVHKAIFPSTGRWLDFLEVELRLDFGNRTFAAVATERLEDPPAELGELQGSFAITPGLVLTACRLSPSRPGAGNR